MFIVEKNCKPLQRVAIASGETGIPAVNDSKEKKTTHITIALDLCSNYIVGYQVSLEKPTTDTAIVVLESVINTHGAPSSVISPKKFSLSAFCQLENIQYQSGAVHKLNRLFKSFKDDTLPHLPERTILSVEAIGDIFGAWRKYYHQLWNSSVYGKPNELFHGEHRLGS